MKWKYCPMCTQGLPITEFRLTNTSRRSVCRLCENAIQRRRYREKKELVIKEALKRGIITP